MFRPPRFRARQHLLDQQTGLGQDGVVIAAERPQDELGDADIDVLGEARQDRLGVADGEGVPGVATGAFARARVEYAAIAVDPSSLRR